MRPVSALCRARAGFTLIELLVVMMIICVLVGLLLPAVGMARLSARRTTCLNNLKQLSLATQNYHDLYERFPPAAFAGPDGTPAHSWRVLLLPFLEQQPLYQFYNFNSRWNQQSLGRSGLNAPGQSASNVSISVYLCTGYLTRHPQAERRWAPSTQYGVLSGGTSAFAGFHSPTIEEFSDGSSKTILYAEFGEPYVLWVEPRDVTPAEFHRELRAERNHPSSLDVAFVDGSARQLASTTDLAIIQALTTPAGSELLPAGF